MPKQYDKVKLKTGEIARIEEVLKEDTDYLASIFHSDGTIDVDQIGIADIASIFVEVEKPIQASA